MQQELAEKEVKRVCIFLGPLDDQCKTMIDTYFPQMWELLQEELVSQLENKDHFSIKYRLIKGWGGGGGQNQTCSPILAHPPTCM